MCVYVYIYIHRTVPRAQALLRGRAWVAQRWAKSVGAVRLRALPLSLVQQGCLRFGVSRCGPAAALWWGEGVRCFVGVNLSSSSSSSSSLAHMHMPTSTITYTLASHTPCKATPPAVICTSSHHYWDCRQVRQHPHHSRKHTH